jgi:hypothetical protein
MTHGRPMMRPTSPSPHGENIMVNFTLVSALIGGLLAAF